MSCLSLSDHFQVLYYKPLFRDLKQCPQVTVFGVVEGVVPVPLLTIWYATQCPACSWCVKLPRPQPPGSESNLGNYSLQVHEMWSGNSD